MLTCTNWSHAKWALLYSFQMRPSFFWLVHSSILMWSGSKILFPMYLQVLQHLPLYHPALKGPLFKLFNMYNIFYAHNTLQGDEAVSMTIRLFRQSCECGLFKITYHDALWCTCSIIPLIYIYLEFFIVLIKEGVQEPVISSLTYTSNFSTHTLLSDILNRMVGFRCQIAN